MTGLLILTFIPAAAAVLFWLRLREQRRIIDHLRHQAVDARVHDDADQQRTQLFGTVAHELRSPIAAILGYEELLTEGVFGALDPRAGEALARIRSSARQLLTLTEGMHELSGRVNGHLDIEDVDYARALRNTYHRAAAEADARRVQLEPPAGTVTAIAGSAEPRMLDAILDAACGAALRTSADRTITSSVRVENDAVLFLFENTGIDPEHIEHEPLASGAGLRIAIARQMAERLGGAVRTIRQADGTTIEIRLPRVQSVS